MGPAAQAGFRQKHVSGSLSPPGQGGSSPLASWLHPGERSVPTAASSPRTAQPRPPSAREVAAKPPSTVQEGPPRAYVGGGVVGACLRSGGGQVREQGSLRAPAKASGQREKPVRYRGKKTEVDWLKSGLYRTSNATRSPLLKYLILIFWNDFP